MGCFGNNSRQYPRKVQHLWVPGLPAPLQITKSQQELRETRTTNRRTQAALARRGAGGVGTSCYSCSTFAAERAGSRFSEGGAGLRPDTNLPISSFASASMIGSDPSTIKINHDGMAADLCLGGDASLGFMAVMDGHGPNGDKVTGMLSSELIPIFERQMAVGIPPLKALKRAFLEQNVFLLQSEIDCSISGSTCAVLAFEGSKSAYTANVGDSRCVVGRWKPWPLIQGGEWEALEWTVDQKPDLPEEERRLLSMGARVEPWHADQGIHQVTRVWLQDSDTPGIAISRSFGDTIGATVGVIAEPVVAQHQLTSDMNFVILATQGIWEFISSEEAVELVGGILDKNGSASDALRMLVVEASRRWIRNEGVADDITAIVLFFDSARLPPPEVVL